MKLGIDFGTTRTVVACADRGNYPILTFCDDAGDAHDWFPSVVAERNGELRFGFDALATAIDAVLNAPVRWKAAATSAADRVRANYGGDAVCSQLEHLYNEIVTPR